jgi:hypothetical protein
MGDEKEFHITVQDRPTQLTYDGKTSGQYSDASTLSATAVSVSTWAAASAAFSPIDVPPQAVTGHVCMLTPSGTVGMTTPMVGALQLTSATSDEPPIAISG